MICELCPRKCGVDRDKSRGVCGVGVEPRVAKAYLHKWEEPCITGKNGSGTIFFSGCNLKCVFCQNHVISSGCEGKDITVSRLSQIFKELEERGATNINLVSPSHYAEAIREALEIYRPSIPIVYNSNGYDSEYVLELLKDYIDIYLVDFKFFSSKLASKCAGAIDYPDVAKKGILRMRKYIPREIFDGDIMKRGVIIRHLILPNETSDSIEILKWLKDNVSEPFISLMGQYVPMYKAKDIEGLNRRLKPIEYKIVENKMLDLGLTRGYTQELSSADESYTPIFDGEGV